MNKREQVLHLIGSHILRHPSHSVVIVGIDGVDGAGKTMFADELATAIRHSGRPIVRASIDGFHRPKIERYRLGRSSPEGFYRDSYNYDALKSLLLDPLRKSGRYRTAIFDHSTDTRVSVTEQQVVPSSIVIFDGIFLHRPELRDYWDVSVFLQVAFDISVARCAARDGSSPDPKAAANRRYVEGQEFYLRSCDPFARATITVDNNDLSAPFVIRSRLEMD